MARRAVSIKDVADRAGVSTATVSNVLSGTKPVSVDLARRVRQAAEELGYEINRAASQLRTGKTRVVTVLVPDLSDPFFTSIITEIESLARLSGYEIIVGNSADDTDIERSRLNALMAWQPAGMIVIPCTDAVPDNLIAKTGEVPFVLVDRVADTSLADSVVIDNKDGGSIAGKYLAEIGHRDVLMVASDMGLVAIRQRNDGAREEIERHGGVARVVEVGPVPDEAATTLERWLERNRLPTAILALTNMTTLATLTCLAKRRTRIPEDVSLIGFDDYPWMSARHTALTAVRQPTLEIARAAWNRLAHRMAGNIDEPKSAVLLCSLAIRDSTLPIQADKPPADKVPARRDSRKQVRLVAGQDHEHRDERGRKSHERNGARKT